MTSKPTSDNSASESSISIRCSAVTLSGRSCQAWAMRESIPPLCSVHAGRNRGAGAPPGNQNSRKHGFYSTYFSLGELSALLTHANNNNLQDEIALARILTDRLHAFLLDNEKDQPPQFYIAVTELLLSATGRIANLLRTQHLLTADTNDAFTTAFSSALDELSNRLNIPL